MLSHSCAYIEKSVVYYLLQKLFHILIRHLWRVYPDNSEVELELISAFWPTLPSGIQAAYENMKDQILFFKGEV